MLKQILFAGLTLATAGLGLPGTANAHRIGTLHHGPWFAHAARGALFVRPRWRAVSRWHARSYARAYAQPRIARAVKAKPVATAATIPAPSLAGGLVGRASFYSGGRTASGGTVGAATCAHRSLPFGTRVLVTNLANLRQMVLVVNDRGPFVGGRIVDVSRPAAAALGMLQSGVATIRMQVVGGPG